MRLIILALGQNMVNYQRNNLLGTEPWTLPRDTRPLRAVLRRPLWGGRGVSARADDLTSQHSGSPCYNPYIVSPALYNGYNSIFDSAPLGCLNIGSATGYFSQYSNSSAVIYMSTEWHPRSGCSGYPLTVLYHYFTYQP